MLRIYKVVVFAVLLNEAHRAELPIRRPRLGCLEPKTRDLKSSSFRFFRSETMLLTEIRPELALWNPFLRGAFRCRSRRGSIETRVLNHAGFAAGAFGI